MRSPELVLTRAGHRFPSSIIAALKEEGYMLVYVGRNPSDRLPQDQLPFES